MQSDNRDSKEPQTEFEKFEDLARKIVQVPKAEADEQEKKYQAERRKEKHKKEKKKPRKKKRGKLP